MIEVDESSEPQKQLRLAQAYRFGLNSAGSMP